MAHWYRWDNTDLVINVLLQPRAKQNEIVGVHANALKIRITTPPVDGKANLHLCQFLADAIGVPRSKIKIISGETFRNKRLRILLKNKVLPAKFSQFD